ncbi:MAG: nucleotidyltransferase domain-containing protein [Prevotella sp.]|nr:nucleotidyltransferase domain-containing protein [Prevotella sp.]MBO5156224.1 nucleotidyltransferase domain-containing protein [Prevotella sp.]MBO5204597.1 nucleotidyltransferase domain-containing protein [Prevotella sp.]
MYGLSDTTINDLRNVFGKFPNIKKVVIFGSRAKGNYHEGSDIDLAIIGNNINTAQISDIYLNIEDLGLLYKVDILDYNKYKDTPIGEHIARVAKPLYTNN